MDHQKDRKKIALKRIDELQKLKQQQIDQGLNESAKMTQKSIVALEVWL